jgi:hypothetical protein
MDTGFALAILAVILIAAVVVALGVAVVNFRTAIAAAFCNLCAALRPSFEGFTPERATTQTLNLLTAAMAIFAAVLIAWGVGAGVMRTAWLSQLFKNELGGGSAAYLRSLYLLPFEIVRAVGGVLAIGLAAGLVGAIVGFIFGIPSQVSASATPPAEAGGTVPARGADPRQAANAWRLSTNLTQVSDWLTKVIIGVSLVEAKAALIELLNDAHAAAGYLFDYRHGSPAVLAAVMIGCAVFGFLYAYLYTELIISRLIVAVDRGLQPGLAAAALTLKNMATITEALVPRISRSARAAEVSEQPAADEVKAALQYIGISFADMLRAGATPDEIRSWARAKALLNDYQAAAQGYIRLLGMQQP